MSMLLVLCLRKDIWIKLNLKQRMNTKMGQRKQAPAH